MTIYYLYLIHCDKCKEVLRVNGYLCKIYFRNILLKYAGPLEAD